MSNPYRSFTLILAAFVVFFGIALSFAAYFLISGQIVRDTSDITRSAVERHFSGLPQLSGLFGEGTAAASDGSAHAAHGQTRQDEHAGHAGMGGSAPATADAASDAAHEALKQVIRTHFDLYQIQEVQMYDRNGTIQFSYDRSRIHTPVADADRREFERVLASDDMLSEKQGSFLRLWIPIADASGHVVGIVEAKRDWSAQKDNILRISLTMALLTAAGMFALFFGLRQLFLRSSRIIERQTEELGDLLARIHRTYDESLQALSSALDSRDNETQGHSYRVTAYSWLLAKELGMRSDQMETLIRGALLHDVGKIGIPDAILRKEGPLDDMEWAIMRTHVSMGVHMLEHIDFLKPALEIVRCHHERWDGGGYPMGLSGEGIPLKARIFAICDSYDAMTSDRPYRSARTHEEAIAELRRCAGTQFCPTCIEAFQRLPKGTLEKVRRLSQQEMHNVSIEQFLPQVG
ncbi:HD-GYP domain-containing protein [Cohnella nanjingensis]|uniref:HD-GYP domain-containing protein n=1 Tax=Cohnella nanjingensis TaxID=1387779 RepID=A0A7X0RTF6_9BACL|nr:HD-GYP domain-containing protein [Cohnella nanjingensis]MBB6673213.1 HD-GYP domain-containing protein [Cohnella nanjingensis]